MQDVSTVGKSHDDLSKNAGTPEERLWAGMLTSGLLAGPSAHLEVLWHLSKMLCRNPRRTSCNRLQKGIGFAAFSLVVPTLGEAGGGTQLPPTGLLLLLLLLLLCNLQRPLQVSLRFTFPTQR